MRVTRQELLAARATLERELVAIEMQLHPLGCGGPETCHGRTGWCDNCGDVSLTCDSLACAVHTCSRCHETVQHPDDTIGANGLCKTCDEEDRVELLRSDTFDHWSTPDARGAE